MLVEAIIVQACSGLYGQQLEACRKGLEAIGLQSGASRDLDEAERATVDLVYQKVFSATGPTVVVVVGATYKTLKDKRLVYPLIKRSEGLVPAICPSIGPNDGKVELKWNF